jgi:hypothetical protein
MIYLPPYKIAKDLSVPIRSVNYWIAQGLMLSDRFGKRRLVKSDYYVWWKNNRYLEIRAGKFKQD